VTINNRFSNIFRTRFSQQQVQNEMFTGRWALRLPIDLSITKDEIKVTLSTWNCDDGSRPNPEGSLEPDKIKERASSSLNDKLQRRQRQVLRVGTWNARTMMRKGKLENVKL